MSVGRFVAPRLRLDSGQRHERFDVEGVSTLTIFRCIATQMEEEQPPTFSVELFTLGELEVPTLTKRAFVHGND